MDSREHARAEADARASVRRRWFIGLARMALGIALLVVLVVWGQIDLRALLELTPSAVMMCLAGSAAAPAGCPQREGIGLKTTPGINPAS